MASDIKEAIRRLIYQYTVEGADKVMATQEAVAASTTKTDKASLSLEKSFGNIERRYVDTVRAQQDYQKVQEKVNAAVAQNPALQERANVVLAQAGQHFDNIATGATKGSIATTALARTLTRTIGPLALIGVAVAGLHSAFEFMMPIAERVGADIYRRFSEAYPAIARVIDGISQMATEFTETEQAKAKVEAINAALQGTASAAQMARLNLELMNQKLVNQRSMAEAAQAAELMADHVMELAKIYPGITQDTAKQLEILQAQLGVAQARNDAEKAIAQEILDQVQYRQQGKKEDEGALLAATQRAIAEERNTQETAKQLEILQAQLGVARARNDVEKAIAQEILDQVQYRQQGKSADDAALLAATQRAIAEAKIEPELDHAGEAIRRNTSATDLWAGSLHRVRSIAEQVANRLSLLHTQFGNEKFEVFIDPLHLVERQRALEQSFGKENVEMVEQRYGQTLLQVPTIKPEYFTNLLQQDDRNAAEKLKDRFAELTDKLGALTTSTDSLNATMQNALSPFYSQDPRTTKLGFRAGVVGNPDWMVGGASNENPLAAILGPGATAPGMANGGSFVVGGGYSANDNRIAAFPVASGEQVVVNRNRGDGGAKIINIDNRTIITGTVDVDALAKLKVSKFQQAQRMRAGLAQAS